MKERTYHRFRFKISASILFREKIYPVQLIDLSLGGALFESTEPLMLANADYALRLYLDEKKTEIHIPMEPIHQFENRVGVLFHSLELKTINIIRQVIESNVGSTDQIRKVKNRNFRTLSGKARENTIQSFLEIASRIFGKAGATALEQEILQSTAPKQWLALFQNNQQAVVGYHWLSLFEKEINGKVVAICKPHIGLLREYRGNHSTFELGWKQMLWYKIRHPTRIVYLWAEVSHPSVYYLLDQYLNHCFPSYQNQRSEELDSLLEPIRSLLHQEKSTLKVPVVTQVSYYLNDTPEDQNYWIRHESEAVQYFLKINPLYYQGNALWVFSELSLAQLITAGYRHLQWRLA